MTRRPALLALADRAGIQHEYTDNARRRRPASDSTREALLQAMGFDVSTEEAAAAALARLEKLDARLLDPVAVVDEGVGVVRVRMPAEASGRVDWSVETVRENGIREHREGDDTVTRAMRALTIPLPSPPEAGYLDIRVELRGDGRDYRGSQLLIVSPGACEPLSNRVKARCFGINASLYACRGGDDRGFGDFARLAELIDYTAASGGDFVGLNPLHALRNRGTWISPYSPVSRLFRSPLYIDIDRVPELDDCPEARSLMQSGRFVAESRRLQALDHMDYAATARLRREVLLLLFECFRRRRAAGAGPDDFERYRARHGELLGRFATASALEQMFVARDASLDDWRRWPAGFRDPASEAVASFRNANARDIEFHEWLQYETDRQLGDMARRSAAKGLRIGVFGDLAIGSAPGSADHWAFRDLFVDGASLGAPPDEYSATGQNWGLPPLHPIALAESGFGYWRAMIRNAVEHVGALRIDHVMGLFRQFWIPAGMEGTEGAYVRFPADALLAILAVESRRARTVIVGEDLGTVPRGLPAKLARAGILSTRVLYFERERSGAFRASRRYSRRALVTANTHDMPPLAGFWSGSDIALRHSIGALGDVELAREADSRRRARDALLARLVTERILPPAARPGTAELCTAVHRFLAHSTAPMMGVSFDDLAGETEPINVPGVSGDRHASWTRRSRLTIAEVAADPDAIRALSGVRGRARRH